MHATASASPRALLSHGHGTLDDMLAGIACAPATAAHTTGQKEVTDVNKELAGTSLCRPYPYR